MLADGVEASVRSLASRDEPAIRAMVGRIIDERISDGQFDECDLTLRDLERIRNAFVRAAPGHVPHADRLPAEHGRGAGVAAGRGAAADRAAGPGGIGGPACLGRSERPWRRRAAGLVTRAIYRPPWRIDLDVRDGVRSPLGSAALARAVAAALEAAGAPAPASIGLILADDAELAGLNATHMGKDGPTDVLSFPLLPPEAFPAHAGAARHRPRDAPPSRCRPAAGRTSATSSCRSSGRSTRPRPAAAARPATSAGPPPTSSACS